MGSVENCEKEFVKALQYLRRRWDRHTVWRDFVDLASSSLLMFTDQDDTAEKRICEINNKYDDKEKDLIQTMIHLPGEAYERNTDQDFLGRIMMKNGLDNNATKQIFTPYSVSKLMAKVSFENDLEKYLQEKGYVTIQDPCCGSGSLLIATANLLLEKGVPYQTVAWFAAQDLDYTAAMVCFIQLNLLGCPGTVSIGNSITHPALGTPLNPTQTKDPKNFFTLHSFISPWPERRLLELNRRSNAQCDSNKENENDAFST